jgi:hypothetical protein
VPNPTIHELLRTSLIEVVDVSRAKCGGDRRVSACAARTQLSFVYRGSYLRHVDGGAVVADVSQVLFFNAGEPYETSHPHPGGDASLILTVDEALLREIAPPEMLEAAMSFLASDAPLDQLLAQLQRMLLGLVGIVVATGSTAPNQRVILGPRQACQLAADQLENLGRAEAGNHERQLSCRGAGRGLLFDIRARASPPYDQALGLEISQGSRDSGAGNPEPFHQLDLTREAP